ncbi:unnamed protein product [Enterobius vermicularis]|uniref:MARVEL domain-containing protein n=1 Tax=Enterobius vermicularis TaxID=51028 RepID=A0A0N4VDW0_ENTVE|nr:unnamed protein product [Enterobius vermicularis]
MLLLIKGTCLLERKKEIYIILFQKGAYIIAFISAFFVLANFVLKAAGISDIGWNWELLFLFVDLVAVACLVGGLWTERPALLQPFVVLSIVTISFLILLTLFFASAVYDSHSYAGEYVEMQLGDRNQQAAELLSVQQKNGNSFGVSLSVAAVIHIWFLIVVVQCAQYLRDMRPFKVSKYRLLIFVLFFSLFCLIGY